MAVLFIFCYTFGKSKIGTIYLAFLIFPYKVLSLEKTYKVSEIIIRTENSEALRKIADFLKAIGFEVIFKEIQQIVISNLAFQ